MNLRRRAGVVRLVVAATALLVAGVLIAVLGQGPGRRVPVPGAVLTAATNFGLSGSVSGLTPGVTTSTLTLTATNPYSVNIAVGSVTVSVLASSPVLASCPLSNLTIDGASFSASPSGSPPAYSLTLSAPTSPLPVTVTHNNSNAIGLPIALARAAGNGCQNVTFPFNYSATAAYTASTNTSLASNPNPSFFTQSIAFTATVASTVSPDPGAPIPAGTVTFYRCTNPSNLPSGSPASSCTASSPLPGATGVALNASGQAVYSNSTLAVGSYAIFATFTPTDPTNFLASSSTSITQVVNKAATSLVLTTGPNPSLFGQSVTISAQTTPAAGPTGTVSFYSCATSACSSPFLLGTGALNSSGKASFTTSALPPGTDYLEGVYSGDGSYLGSTSNPAPQTVNFSSPCIITTINGGYTVAAGKAICISSPGRVNGGVTVQKGGSLYLNGARVDGGVTATTSPAGLRFCGSTINGNVTVTGATGFVLIGDAGDDGAPGCAANAISLSVTLTNGTAGFELGGNSVLGSVSVSGNSGAGPTAEDAAPEIEGNSIVGILSCATTNTPAVVDGGQRNTVIGLRSGQCSGVKF